MENPVSTREEFRSAPLGGIDLHLLPWKAPSAISWLGGQGIRVLCAAETRDTTPPLGVRKTPPLMLPAPSGSTKAMTVQRNYLLPLLGYSMIRTMVLARIALSSVVNLLLIPSVLT
ncbi:hypothetical protein Hypma_010640 [Hypsizygus marmoreus]|uniref:Uncharacterized protein n=1 Tax=Hypsizygus marmoreus TaxID=39966 RepID=A0A369JSA9_HYPMA|nr:hypothetical protein Hypma_010640 [Hypsizygus marmoreus]